MRAELSLLLVTGALLAPGCAGGSLATDLAAVHRRAGGDFPILREGVDPRSDEDARAILAAPLDESAAVQVAVLNNRGLRAQLRELGIARGHLVQAGLLPNPELELARPAEPGERLEVGLEYELTHALLAPLRASIAAAELEARRHEAAAAVIRLGFEVRVAFRAYQAEGQRLVLAQRSLDAFAASRDAAIALFDAGNVPALDVASQVAVYERARAAVVRIELDVALAREQLQRLLGLHGSDTTWSVTGALPDARGPFPALEAVEARALKSNLELAATARRIERLTRQVGLARLEGWLPEISVGAHAVLGHGEGAEHDAWRLGGGLRIGLPLFDRRQGLVSAHQAELQALAERYHGTAVEVRSRAREAKARLVSAHARARHFEEVILPAQRRVVEETVLQYNAMQIGVFQLLQARREELDVELARLDALRELWTSSAALQAVLAGQHVTISGGAAASPISAGAAPAGGH